MLILRRRSHPARVDPDKTAKCRLRATSFRLNDRLIEERTVREGKIVTLSERAGGKKKSGGIVTKEAKRYITIYSQVMYSHTHIYIHIYVWLIILLLTCQMYVEAIMDHECEGSFGIVAMWNVKEYIEVCMNESRREKVSERGRGRAREWKTERFAICAREFRPSPGCILRGKRVVSAIWPLCCLTCDFVQALRAIL